MITEVRRRRYSTWKGIRIGYYVAIGRLMNSLSPAVSIARWKRLGRWLDCFLNIHNLYFIHSISWMQSFISDLWQFSSFNKVGGKT